jgi:hypothetical protein
MVAEARGLLQEPHVKHDLLSQAAGLELKRPLVTSGGAQSKQTEVRE